LEPRATDGPAVAARKLGGLIASPEIVVLLGIDEAGGGGMKIALE
jgi:hypothetical protein